MFKQQLFFLIIRLDFIAPLVTLLYYFYRRVNSPKTSWWFIYFLVSLFLVNSLSQIVVEVQGKLNQPKNNLIVYHMGCIVYFLVLLKYFSSILTTSFQKIIDWIFAIGFFTLAGYNFAKHFEQISFNSNTFGLLSFWIIVKSLFYYAKKINEPPTVNILESREFWSINGLFFYFTMTFFIFLFYHFISSHVVISNQKIPMVFTYLWGAHNIIITISCIIYSKSIKCNQ